MNETIQLLDVVVLTQALPQRGLRRGQVGTIVELLGHDKYKVEFSDNSGQTYAELALRASQLIVLHYEPA